jgi:hypothetical protein
MSEYQYYEFQAVDRPLTPEEQQAVARLSSRTEPHPWRAVFTYSWSDFPADAKQILAKYYDAMLYLANWGSRELMFRFPQDLIALDRMRRYNVATTDYPSDAVTVSKEGEYAFLDIRLDEERGLGWIEGEGWLDRLIGLRETILRGDYRLLYLAWLKGLTVTYDVDEEALEPPIPPGLNDLTPPLREFVELFDVDPAMIRSAAKRSPRLETPALSEDDLREAIAQIPPEEKEGFLLRLARDEPCLSLALNRRLGTLTDVPPAETEARRTVAQVLRKGGWI